MNDIRQAAETAKNLGKQLKAIIQVGEFLENISDLDQRAREAEVATTKAIEARDQAQEQLQKVELQVLAAQGDLADAKEEAAKLKADAVIYRDTAQAEARSMAKQVVDAAKSKAKEIEAKILAADEAHQEQLANFAKEIEAEQVRLDGLKSEADALRARLLGE